MVIPLFTDSHTELLTDNIVPLGMEQVENTALSLL
jgi:hypothetical protein